MNGFLDAMVGRAQSRDTGLRPRHPARFETAGWPAAPEPPVRDPAPTPRRAAGAAPPRRVDERPGRREAGPAPRPVERDVARGEAGAGAPGATAAAAGGTAAGAARDGVGAATLPAWAAAPEGPADGALPPGGRVPARTPPPDGTQRGPTRDRVDEGAPRAPDPRAQAGPPPAERDRERGAPQPPAAFQPLRAERARAADREAAEAAPDDAAARLDRAVERVVDAVARARVVSPEAAPAAARPGTDAPAALRPAIEAAPAAVRGRHASQPPAAAPLEPEAVVHVHIGRIEVRLPDERPQPAPPKRQPAGPRLADYLEGRR